MRGDSTFRSCGQEARSGYGQAVSKAGEERARSREASQEFGPYPRGPQEPLSRLPTGKQHIEKTAAKGQKEVKRGRGT